MDACGQNRTLDALEEVRAIAAGLHGPSADGNLAALLAKRVAAAPGRLACRFLERRGAVHEYSWLELWRAALEVARHLTGRCDPGVRILLACGSQRHFVVSLYGCILAGCVAVPAPPAARKRLGERLNQMAVDARAGLVLVDSNEPLAVLSSQSLPTVDVRSLPGQQGTADAAQAWKLPASSSETLAFLQYTSGSTSEPKGVMVTHGNVLANCAAIAQAMHVDDNTRFLTALPLFHDMGLVGGVLAPLFAGSEATFMDPAMVVQDPRAWLSSIQAYGITLCGGPDFMYDLAADVSEQATEELDLSSWNVAYCGAEPIRPTTVARFCARFEPHGFKPSAFYPCYGLAEATLFVTGGHAGRPVLLDTSLPGCAAVNCGHAWGDTQVTIVDPNTFDEMPLGAEGEIWVKGSAVAVGYWEQPLLTEQCFSARVRSSGAGPYLRTGDLGRLRNGNLHVTGRLKDLIVLRGRKLVPQDLEAEAEHSHPGVRSSIAFSYKSGETERLAVIAETSRDWLRRTEDRETVRSAIIAGLFTAFHVHADVVELVPPGSLPRTSSGKVRRGHMREMFLDEPSTAAEAGGAAPPVRAV